MSATFDVVVAGIGTEDKNVKVVGGLTFAEVLKAAELELPDGHALEFNGDKVELEDTVTGTGTLLITPELEGGGK